MHGAAKAAEASAGCSQQVEDGRNSSLNSDCGLVQTEQLKMQPEATQSSGVSGVINTSTSETFSLYTKQ